MKPMARVLLLAVAAWVQAAGAPAWPEDPSASVRLDLELARKPSVVQSVPDPKAVEKDAEQAVAQIKARAQSEELARQVLRAPFRRPDLDRDVIGGIQSRNLTDALRGR